MKPFRMFTWEDEGDFNAFGFQTWEKLNPGQGQYDWAWLDKWLDFQKARNRLTAFSVAIALSELSGWNGRFYDATPQWVYSSTGTTMNGRKVGKVISWTDTQANPPVTYYSAVPLYSDLRWRDALNAFVIAFGARYGNDPRLDYVILAPGLDMETQRIKSPWPSDGQERAFDDLCTNYPRWYKSAFPNKQLFYACAPGQGRMRLAKICKEIGIGVKHNGGFLPDIDSWDGYGMSNGKFVNYDPALANYSGLSWGLWDHMAWCNANGVPVAIEDAHWMGKKEFYNGRFGALNYRPVFVDLHSGFFDEATYPKEQLDFVEAYTNVTMQTTPAVWCVLRDQEYELETWQQKNSLGVYEQVGCSGHVGNWEFGLVMEADSDAPRIKNIDTTEYGRQCRRVNDALFYIDKDYAFPPYEIEVTWKQEDKTLIVSSIDQDYMVGSQAFASTGTGEWITTKAVVPSGAFILKGGAAVHMIKATHVAEEPPEPPTMDPKAMQIALISAKNDLEEAERSLELSRLALNRSRENTIAAQSRLADAESSMSLTLESMEDAKIEYTNAQGLISQIKENLAFIEAELEKAE